MLIGVAGGALVAMQRTKSDHGKFNDCLTSSVGISTGSSKCCAVSGEFGAYNYKVICLLG